MQKPIHLAVEYEHLDILKYLMEEGNKWDQKCLDDLDWREKNQDLLRNYTQQDRIKICGKIDIEPKDENGQRPIHYAARIGNLNMVKYLMEVIKEKYPKDFDGKTPLDLAKEYENEEVVKFLESLPKNPKDSESKTPLEENVVYYLEKVIPKYFDVKTLLDLVKEYENEENEFPKDSEGKTPLDEQVVIFLNSLRALYYPEWIALDLLDQAKEYENEEIVKLIESLPRRRQ